MQWREFEGLDYLKLVFSNRNESQRFLKQPIFMNDIPIIVLPKIYNKNPLGMLVYHQLRIQSLNGPTESRLVYEFLLKFGSITDFLVLDSIHHPTAFLITFTTNVSKRLLAGCCPNNTATLYDKNRK